MTVVIVLVALNFALPAAPGENARAGVPRAGGDPPWPTYHGDDARTGNTSEPGPQTNNLLWSNSTGSYSYSSPAIAGGKAYIPADDGGMYCFWAENGTRVWRTALSSPAWSGPAVDVGRNRVFVCDGTGLAFSNSRNIYCLNASTGSQVWKKSLSDYGESSPLIYGDTVIVGSGDSYVGGKNNALISFRISDGSQAWSVPSAGSCASPALYDGRLYSVGNGLLRCMDPATGAFYWNATVSHGYGSPSAADGRVFYPGANGNVYAFNASTGASLWTKATGQAESYSTCAISNGSLYLGANRNPINGGGGAVVKMDVTDGSIGWTYNIAAPNGCWGTPAVSGGQVYFGYGSTVVCLNVSDKSQVWSYTGPAGSSSYGIGSSPAIAAGKLYIGASESKLYCFGPGIPNEPPAAVKLESPANINETAMTLNWTKNADADFARYELHMSKAPGFTILPGTLVQPDGNVTDVNRLSLRVKNLEFTMRYFFRLRVWDNGIPPMFNDSNEVDGTTLTPNGAPEAVKLFPAEDVTPYSMRLSWSVNSDSDFDRYEVHRSQQKVYVPSGSTLAATIRDINGNSTVVRDLKPWTTYYIKVRVYDRGMPVLYSDSNQLEVLSGNTPPTAVVLNPPQMGATSADLSWSASADDDFASYEVHFSQEQNFTASNDTRAARISNKPTTDYSISGLQLARTYYFMVRVVDQGGMWNDSERFIGLTANTVPKPVISSPTDGDTFDTRTPVDFDCSASSDQDLDPLRFYWTSSVDGPLSSNATFTRMLSEGTHRITLFANDGHGHNVSARVSITVNKAPNRRPSVAVLSPADNSQVSGVVELAGAASDIDGNDTLRSVQVKIAKGDWDDAEGVGEWTYMWNTSRVQNGKYRVLFRSFDGELYSPESSLSLTVNNVFINQKPKVALNPLPSARLSRSAVITGTASDADGAVAYVEVSVDGGAWQRAFGTRDWAFTLDTTELRNGAHSLQARAFDGTDHSDAAMLNFTVSNAGPATSTGPGALVLGGLALVIIIAVVAAVLLMRRRKGPEAPAMQVVSGQEAAAQQGLVQDGGQEAAPAPAPPAYSAFYGQPAGYSQTAQPGEEAGAGAPVDVGPAADQPQNRQ
jgi:outer membrane protein assembly factor BamB